MEIEGAGKIRPTVVAALVAYALILLAAIKYTSKTDLVWYVLPFFITVAYFIVKRIKGYSKSELYEKAWVVHSEGLEIVSVDYKKNHTAVEISKIRTVVIETNDSGPWGTDVWWTIEDGKSKIHVPGGATGEQEMIKRLETIDGFDSKEVIKAMGCTSNQRFIAYQAKNKEI